MGIHAEGETLRCKKQFRLLVPSLSVPSPYSADVSSSLVDLRVVEVFPETGKSTRIYPRPEMRQAEAGDCAHSRQGSGKLEIF